MIDHLNKATNVQRIALSLFGHLIPKKEERKEMDPTPPSQELLENNYKPIHTKEEAHLETIFGDCEDICI